MKLKDVKKQSAKMLARCVIKTWQNVSDSACCYIYHQPKMPEALKNMKQS